MVYIIIASAAVIVLCAVLIYVYSVNNKKKKKSDAEKSMFRSVSYSVSGGMEGGGFDVTLSAFDELVLSVYDCPYHGAKEKRTKRSVALSVSEEIALILKKSELKAWSEAPESDTFALDAPTTSFSVWYRDGDSFNVSLERDIPPEAFDTINAVKELMLKYAVRRK